MADDCTFCRVADRTVPAAIISADRVLVSFLDHRPLFLGHVLLIPRHHVPALADLPTDLVGPFFERVQALERAVVAATEAEGSFVAINNVVSQSVPHLHVHIVPRRRGDGLRGFFWPRTQYADEDAMESVAERIRSALA